MIRVTQNTATNPSTWDRLSLIKTSFDEEFSSALLCEAKENENYCEISISWLMIIVTNQMKQQDIKIVWW